MRSIDGALATSGLMTGPYSEAGRLVKADCAVQEMWSKARQAGSGDCRSSSWRPGTSSVSGMLIGDPHSIASGVHICAPRYSSFMASSLTGWLRDISPPGGRGMRLVAGRRTIVIGGLLSAMAWAPLMDVVQPAEAAGRPKATAKAAPITTPAQASARLGFDLLTQLAKAKGADPNPVVSPASLTVALAVLDLGASPKFHVALVKTLRLDGTGNSGDLSGLRWRASSMAARRMDRSPASAPCISICAAARSRRRSTSSSRPACRPKSATLPTPRRSTTSMPW